jgi:hypothetical protein
VLVSIGSGLGRDLTTFLKAAGFAASFVAGFATVTAQPEAAQLDRTVREGQGVTTELSANASAITCWVKEADAWQVVTTVDILTGRSGDSNNHAISSVFVSVATRSIADNLGSLNHW